MDSLNATKKSIWPDEELDTRIIIIIMIEYDLRRQTTIIIITIYLSSVILVSALSGSVAPGRVSQEQTGPSEGSGEM